MRKYRAITAFVVIICVLLAPGTAAQASFPHPLPGLYAVSVVNWKRCLGRYLAYDTKNVNNTNVFLIPSSTSEPPLWRVIPAPGGISLIAVNRTDAAGPPFLSYRALPCSSTSLALRHSQMTTFGYDGGFLTAARRKCKLRALDSLPSTCRGVTLALGLPKLNNSMKMWHFTPYPASPLELYTEAPTHQAKPPMIYSMDMDNDTIVQGTLQYGKPYPMIWRLKADGVWRRGHLKVPRHPPNTWPNLAVALGDSFVAVVLTLADDETIPDLPEPYWRLYLYDKARLGAGPVATFAPGALEKQFASLTAGGNTVAVGTFPNITIIYSLGKDGKWTRKQKFAMSGEYNGLTMSPDGRILTTKVYKNDLHKNGVNVVVYRQDAAGRWALEAELYPTVDGQGRIGGVFAVTNDNIIVSTNDLIPAPRQTPTCFYYRRSAAGNWTLEQTMPLPYEPARIMVDGDIMVMYVPSNDPAIYIYKRSPVTGKWDEGRKAGPLPRWKDEFAQGPSAGAVYGEVALSGKRLAITGAFANWDTGRSSPAVTFIYDDVEDL